MLEGHQRLITPFTALAFAAIALTALLHGEFNRRGQLKRILLAVAVAVAFEVVDLGLRNIATRLPIAIPLLYLNALLPTLVGCTLMFRGPRRALSRTAALPQPAQ